MLRVLFLCLVLSVWTLPARCAEIQISNYQSNGADDTPLAENNFFKPFISLKGEIIDGDYAKVRDAARTLSELNAPLVIMLESPGGNVGEALKIAEFIRESWGTTWLKGRTALLQDPDRSTITCDSACAIIFFGGVERRYLDSNVRVYATEDDYFIWPEKSPKANEVYVDGALLGSRAYAKDQSILNLKAEVIPVLGLHRPYIRPEVNSQLTGNVSELFYSEMEDQVRTRLSALGVPVVLIDRMMRTPSSNIDRISGFKLLDFLPSTEPWFEEWIISKCGGLTRDEWLVFGRAKGEQRNSLKSRRDYRVQCQLNAVLTKQREIFQH